jgi:hypothetical protein
MDDVSCGQVKTENLNFQSDLKNFSKEVHYEKSEHYLAKGLH